MCLSVLLKAGGYAELTAKGLAQIHKNTSALPRPNQKSISLSVFTRKRERQVDLERKSKTPLCTTLLPLIAYRGEGYTTRQYHKEACRPRHYAVAKLIPT